MNTLLQKDALKACFEKVNIFAITDLRNGYAVILRSYYTPSKFCLKA